LKKKKKLPRQLGTSCFLALLPGIEEEEAPSLTRV
jgi:hypothetical protein